MSGKRDMDDVLTFRVYESTNERVIRYHENSEGSKADALRRIIGEGLDVVESETSVEEWRRELDALQKDKTRLQERIDNLEDDLDGVREERDTLHMETTAGDLVLLGVGLLAIGVAFANQIRDVPIVTADAVSAAALFCLLMGVTLRLNFAVGDPFGKVLDYLRSIAGAYLSSSEGSPSPTDETGQAEKAEE